MGCGARCYTLRMQKPWHNRITGHAELAAGEIVANPKNWRLHPDFQSDALAGALDEIGWIDEVTISERSGLVVDGHVRVTLALARSDAERVPVRSVDLTPAQELAALATKDGLHT